MLNKIYKINKGLNKRFPDGKDPFKIITRLCEECGELAEQVNHFENTGIKIEKHGQPDKGKLAKECQDVIRSVLAICSYYKAENELEESINKSLKKMEDEGLV